MRFYRYRSNYWSCSNFANWILSFFDITKPDAETSKGWKLWKIKVVSMHPFVYKFVEDWLDNLQDILMFPYDIYDNIRIYIRNRFITRTHLIDTRMIPGEWHETDERLLNGMFELLVDFIEIEKAHMNNWCKPEAEKPWWLRWRSLRWGENRSREDGLAYLEWEMKLTNNRETHFTQQAEMAREQYEIYVWWKDIRPSRPDPYEITGWSTLNNTLNPTHELDGIEDSDDRVQLRNLSMKIWEMEESWHKEDEEMLIRLVKINRSLWT